MVPQTVGLFNESILMHAMSRPSEDDWFSSFLSTKVVMLSSKSCPTYDPLASLIYSGGLEKIIIHVQQRLSPGKKGL